MTNQLVCCVFIFVFLVFFFLFFFIFRLFSKCVLIKRVIHVSIQGFVFAASDEVYYVVLFAGDTVQVLFDLT